MKRADESASGPRRGPSRRWWWVLVAAAAVVVAAILVRGGGDEGGPPGAADTPAVEPAEPGTGSLTIGGEPAGPLLEGGDLSGHVGEEVIGTLVVLDSIIADGVYWAGEGRTQILLVEPVGQVTPIGVNDALTFTGTLAALDDDVRSAIWGTEAEPTIEAQGAFVAVDELVPEPVP